MKEILLLAALLMCVNILLTVLRIPFSHNIPERVVILDTINTMIIALMVLLGAALNRALYIDIGIVYGLISFIGTLYVARLLERKRGL